MRKMVLWILGIVAVVVLLSMSQEIAQLLATVRQGALIPLVVAAIFQMGKYIAQSLSVAASFNSVGEEASWRKMIPLVFGGIFINTIAPTGGTASAVLLIDDARKRGISAGSATSAALVAQMGVYSGFIVIMIIGFIILQFSGMLDPAAFICGMVLVVAVAFFGGILFVGRHNKGLLIQVFLPIEHLVHRFCTKFLKHKIPKPWADELVESFAQASNSIANNPSSALSVLGFSTLSSGLELLCFISVGFAFGLHAVNELIAGYVVTNIFTIVSPSPNGVGFAEAAATLVLTSYGTPATVSTAIALVFRGFVFWIPFGVGAILLRRTSFFTKKSQTEDEKAKQAAYLCALFLFVLGLANVLFAIVPSIPFAYEVLSTWLSIGTVFSGTTAVLLGIALILMSPGLARRSRTSWAWSIALLIFLAAAQLMSAHTYYAAVVILALAVWLFVKRACFDQLLVYENMKSTIVPVLLALFITFGYGIAGFIILSDHFVQTGGVIAPLWSTIETFIPQLEQPEVLTSQGEWFIGSIRTVAIVSGLWAVVTILFSWLHMKQREKQTENTIQ